MLLFREIEDFMNYKAIKRILDKSKWIKSSLFFKILRKFRKILYRLFFFFSGGSKGPEVCVKNEIAQLRKSVPRAVKTAPQQQQDFTAAAVDHQGSCKKL